LNKERLKTHKTQLLALALMSLFLISAGGLLYYYQARQFKQYKRAELHTITEIKVLQLARWMEERHYDATEIYDSPLVNKYLSEWIKNPNNPELKKTIEKRLEGWLRHGTYHNSMILDPQGHLLASHLDDISAAGPETRNFAQKVAKERQILTNDFYRCTSCDVVHMDVMLPVINAKDKKVIAVIVLRINSEDYLFPLIQLWPVPSKTSAAMLLRREGDQLINLSDLPNKRGTALTGKFNLSSKNQATIKAFNNGDGVAEDYDFNKNKALSGIRRVPGTSWYLVAKTDISEAYAQLRFLGWAIFSAITALILLTGTMIMAISIGQRRDYYKKLYQLELEHETLLKHFDYIVKYANDIIILHDGDFNIIEANDRALQSYGYTQQEMVGMNLDNIVAGENRQQMQQRIDGLDASNGRIFEAVHRNKLNKEFTVEVSLRNIPIDDKLYYQCIVRNISERKKSEKLQTILYAISQVTNSSVDLADLYEHIHQIVSELIPAHNFYIALVSDDESMLNFPYFVDEVDPHPEIRPIGRGLTEYVLKTKSPLLVSPSLYKEMSERGDVSTVGTLSHNWLGVPLIAGGSAIGVLVVQSYKKGEHYSDKDKDMLMFVSDHIAAAIQRKKIEYNLRESEAQKGLILQSMPVAVYTSKVNQESDANWISGNVVELTGFTSDEFISQPDFWRKRLHPDDYNRVMEKFKNATLNKQEIIEYRWQHKAGHYEWFQDMFIIRDIGQRQEFLGILSDINNRKISEQVLQKRQEALGAVYRIATSLGESFQSVCDRVVTDLTQILNVPYLMVQLLKDGKINTVSFLSEGRMQNNLESPLEGTPCQVVFEKGEPLEVNDSLQKLFPSFPLIQQYDINAYLGVPFKNRSGKVLGLICIFDYRTHIFSQEEMHLLDIFAHYLGYEIERVDLEHKIREIEKIKLLSSIASGVAHEVRNPLHAIQSLSEAMAKEMEGRPEYQEYLDHIKVQVNRLSQLMKELLELGKPIQPALFKKESLKELAGAAVNYWKEAQPETRLKLRLDNSLMPESFVFADGTKIQEVIINLLDNASQHTSDHHEVTVALLPAGEKQVMVKVIDRGEGIKPQDLPLMFEPFFTTRKKGTGLGLTLCQRIIESHRGTIEINNNQNGPGCTAQFTLPLYYGD
jgi:PAS domain S-box-containing protein